MKKRMLRDDLRALYRGETAKYACEEAAGHLSFVLSCRESEFARRGRPKEPERRDYADPVSYAPKIPARLHFGAIGEGGIAFIYVYCRGLMRYANGQTDSFWLMFGAALICGMLVSLLVELCGCGIRRCRMRAHRRLAERRYEEAVIRYRQELEEEMRIRKAEAAYREEMLRVIGEYRAAAEKIGDQLETLYGEIGIPEHLRGLAAAERFRKYIDSGVCSELGGREGAYSRYRSELRAGRILESADELRRAGNREMPAQADLMNELRAIADRAGTLLGPDRLPDADKKREYDRYIARHAECLNGLKRDRSQK